MKNPKVTISIPTYNQEKYILKAVNSAISQSYPNIKINISDDCSTDDTFKLCKEHFKHIKNISIYKNSNNLGRVLNYRKLFYEYSLDSEWVINLDGDDFFTDNHFIERALNEIYSIEDSSSIVLYHSQINLSPFKYENIKSLNENSILIQGKDYFIKRPLMMHWVHFGAIIRRNIAVNSFFYKFDSLNMDALSIRLLSLEGTVIVNDNKVGFWNLNDMSESNSSNSIEAKKKFFKNETLFRELSKKKLSQSEYLEFLDNLKISEQFNYIISNLTFKKKIYIIQIFLQNKKLRKYYTRSILYNIKMKLIRK